jgi:hypothetical protein
VFGYCEVGSTDRESNPLERICRLRIEWNREPSERMQRRSLLAIFDTLSLGLRRTLVDESTIGNVGIELENDPSGLWWTLVLVPGSQKVRGSNPLGSTKSVSGGSDWAFALRL